MATNITEYNATAGSNTSIDSINLQEGQMVASDVNNAIRSLMSHLKNVDTGSQALTSPSFTAMSTDTISEKTSANGVSIDGVTLKDGGVGTTASPVALHATSLNGGQIGGRRNIIINGAMQVAQRGTSFTSVSGSAYHLDRFRTGMGDTTARFTVTQATAGLNGFGNSLKYDCTTAESSLSNAGARLFIQHRLEGQDLQQLKKGTSDAEKVTVSFYVKTNKSGVYTVELYDVDNTRSISQTITVSDANWNRYTLTFDGDTTGTLDNDNANSLDLIIHLIAGTTYTGGTFSTSWSSATDNTRVSSSNVNIGDSTDNNFEITGVQLEVGQATPFEHRSFGEELALCQRYYEKSYEYGTASGTNTGIGSLWAGGGVTGATTSFLGGLIATYRTIKRGSTAVTMYDLSGNSGKIHRFQLGTVSSANNTAYVGNDGTTGFTVYSASGASASGIQGHFEADSEL